MAERIPDDSSPEYSKPPLPSEEMFFVAKRFQQEVEQRPLTYEVLDRIARDRCVQLNSFADQASLMGERASVSAERVLLAEGRSQIDGQRFIVHRPRDLDRLETITGNFSGYGYLVTEHDDGYRCTIGAKIITGYDTTLPFSEGALVTFCPVDVSQIEFEREQKEQQLDEIRVKLDHMSKNVPWEIVEDVEFIDKLATGQAIVNVIFLHELYVKVQLLLMHVEKMPDSSVPIDLLLELLSVHLGLPQKLNINTNMYRSPIAGSSEWRVYRSNKGTARYLPGIESHLLITQSMQRQDIFLAGTHEDRAVQVPLSDVVIVEPALK
jgi:hypothetical protein